MLKVQTYFKVIIMDIVMGMVIHMENTMNMNITNMNMDIVTVMVIHMDTGIHMDIVMVIKNLILMFMYQMEDMLIQILMKKF
mmetsp:Transcript_40316/g.86028  ORF Transcript_40316/g.86028 Transcript_40316/m.86028 type:complete len:82 (+) Transcript_40316:487-732(+)